MRPRKCRVDSRLRSDRHAEREAAAGAEAWTAVQATAGARIGPHEAHAVQRLGEPVNTRHVWRLEPVNSLLTGRNCEVTLTGC